MWRRLHSAALCRGFDATTALAPCLGVRRQSGRNTFVSPGYWSVDNSLFENFRLTERLTLQVWAEAFNVFNHKLSAWQHSGDPFFGAAGEDLSSP
jgi:hypothetical protein